MAVQISVRDNIKDVTRYLDRVQRDQVPFATALAITRTAKAVEQALRGDIGKVFDNPTSFISRGTFSTSAKKNDLNALVGMRNQGRQGGATPADYVREQFEGGQRGRKPFEKALAAAGALPIGWRAMPAAGIKLDRYGNPDRKTIVEVLGALKRNTSIFSGRGKRAAQIGYFVVMPGAEDPRVKHLPPGVWRRIQRGGDRAAVPVFVFVEGAGYTARIDLPALAQTVVEREFPRQIQDALSRALATAR